MTWSSTGKERYTKSRRDGERLTAGDGERLTAGDDERLTLTSKAPNSAGA